jgi:hypothetical protein
MLSQYGALENQDFNALINLNDPGSPGACCMLEERGFFFTGLQPLAGSYEYMILHYSPAIAVPFERVMVIPEFEEQFKYIQTKYKEARHDTAYTN